MFRFLRRKKLPQPTKEETEALKKIAPTKKPSTAKGAAGGPGVDPL